MRDAATFLCLLYTVSFDLLAQRSFAPRDSNEQRDGLLTTHVIGEKRTLVLDHMDDGVRHHPMVMFGIDGVDDGQGEGE